MARKKCTFSSLEKNIIAGTRLCILAGCYPNSIAGGYSVQHIAHLDSLPVGVLAHVQAVPGPDMQNPVQLPAEATQLLAAEADEQTEALLAPAGRHTNLAAPHEFAASQHELCGPQPHTAAKLPGALDGHTMMQGIEPASIRPHNSHNIQQQQQQ